MILPRYSARGKYAGSAWMIRPHSETNLLSAELEFLASSAGIFVEIDMKKGFALIDLVLLPALEWAALHDILKGEQGIGLE